MNFDSARRDIQNIRHILLRFPGGQPLQDFELSLGEVWVVQIARKGLCAHHVIMHVSCGLLQLDHDVVAQFDPFLLAAVASDAEHAKLAKRATDGDGDAFVANAKLAGRVKDFAEVLIFVQAEPVYRCDAAHG